MTVSDEVIMAEAIRLVQEGLSVTLPVGGRSMLPFIIGGEESVILSRALLLEKGQIVLAWVDGCRYVVHRIIAIDGERLKLMGDGNIRGTETCLCSDVKAIATHVVDRHGRRHDLYSKWRLAASRLWNWLRPIRRYLLAVYRLKELKKKI